MSRLHSPRPLRRPLAKAIRLRLLRPRRLLRLSRLAIPLLARAIQATPPAPTPPKEPVLASETAVVKQLTEQMATMQKQLDEQAAARRLSEVKLGFAQMTEGKKFALAPAVMNKAQQITVQLSEDKGNAFMGLLKEILDGGLVELGERGGRPNPAAGNADPRMMLDNLVTKKLSESNGKLQYVDALELVYAENPSLYESYRQGQLGGV